MSEFTVVRDVYRGHYGNGDERMNRLRNAGYDPNCIQNLVNTYDHSAIKTICGEFGNKPNRFPSLRAAGYDRELVQWIVNWKLK